MIRVGSQRHSKKTTVTILAPVKTSKFIVIDFDIDIFTFVA